MSEMNRWMKIEALIRAGKSNEEITEMLGMNYGKEYYEDFRKYLKAKDAQDAVNDTEQICSCVGKVEPDGTYKTTSVKQTADGFEINGNAAPHLGDFLSEEIKRSLQTFKPENLKLNVTGSEARGVLLYSIDNKGVKLGDPATRGNAIVIVDGVRVKWEDLDRFIREMYIARNMARGMVE